MVKMSFCHTTTVHCSPCFWVVFSFIATLNLLRTLLTFLIWEWLVFREFSGTLVRRIGRRLKMATDYVTPFFSRRISCWNWTAPWKIISWIRFRHFKKCVDFPQWSCRFFNWWERYFFMAQGFWRWVTWCAVMVWELWVSFWFSWENS